MNCSWQEEDAYRFAEGGLAAEQRAAFGAHLQGCALCTARLAEAQRVDGLLRAAVTPLPAPGTLAARVANAVAAEREAQRRPKGLVLFGRRLAPVLVGVAAALVLAVASYAVAPGAVMALAQRVLFFVPGLGIKPVGESTLVAPAPVSVQEGDTIFTVVALLSDGKQTAVKFEVTGLPADKQGWDRRGQPIRQPALRDSSGHEYAALSANTSVGGTPGSNTMHGTLYFAPLPGDLSSIDVLVPMDYLLPPEVLPESDSRTWLAHVPLTAAEQSDLPSATPQSAEATANGVTLKVTASSTEDARTVLLVEGEAAGTARLVALKRMGGDVSQAATLRDDRGREYKLVPQGSDVTHGGDPLRQDLYFEPVAADAQQLTLAILAVLVEEQSAADVTISLAGRKLGETFEVNRTVDVGGCAVILKSATLSAGQTPGSGGQPWLYVDVELPAGVEGRTLASFTPRVGTGNSAAMWSMGKRGGEQLDRFGVPVEAGAGEVTIRLDRPVLTVEGPWEMSFPAGQ